jgi:hypothetical protein
MSPGPSRQAPPPDAGYPDTTQVLSRQPAPEGRLAPGQQPPYAGAVPAAGPQFPDTAAPAAAPAGPGRRITDAFAWLSARPAADGGWAASGSSAAQPPRGAHAAPTTGQASGRNNRILVTGACVVAAVAVAGVIVTPRLLGSADPGCRAYAGDTLTAYNKTIGDLNSDSAQSTLSKDMTTTIADLSTAIGQTHSASVKTALNSLLTELKEVRSEVKSGSVPGKTVQSLNTASTTADAAC